MASAIVKVLITGDAKGVQSAARDTVKSLDKIETKAKTTGSKMLGAAKNITAGIAGAAVAIGGIAVKAALEGEKAQARFESAVKNAGGSVDVYNKRLEALTGKYAKLGFENDDLQNSMAKLTAATHSPEKAMSRLALVADIARGRNINLSTATDLLAKVETGHVSLLGRLGIATKDASGKTITAEAAVRKLSDMYGGAAQRNAETFAGKAEALKANLHNMEEQIGEKLLPILAKLAEMVAGLITWFSKHKAATIALAVVIGGIMLAATIAWGVALFTTGGALAFLISPITLVVAGVAALALGVYLAYQKFGLFHSAVDGAWQILQSVFNWIRDHWKLVLELLTGPIAIAVLWITDHWSGLKGVFMGVFEGLGNFVSETFRNIENTIIGVINSLIGAWNKVPFHKDIAKLAYVQGPDPYAGVGGGGTTGHAGGGHVGGTTGSGPVHVSAMASGGGTTVHVNMPAGSDPSAVNAAIRRYDKRNGL